jgi:hypothetical protein
VNDCVEGLIALDSRIEGTMLCYIRYYGEVQSLFRQLGVQSSDSICFIFATDCCDDSVARKILVSVYFLMADCAESITCDQEDNPVYERLKSHCHQ